MHMTPVHDRPIPYRAAIAVCAAALFLLVGLPGASVSSQAASDESWLFIAYMSADEAGSPLNWSADINEMESGLLSQNITVIALVDPPGTGDSRVYKILRDPIDSQKIVSAILPYAPLGAGGEATMGDPATLTSFADFAIDGYYKGGKVALIPWGHGNGWMGVCEDKGDYLEPTELDSAMGAIATHLGRPIDLVAFDACSMSSFELLPLLYGDALYSVSSEIQVPEYGFPYDSVLKGISTDLRMSSFDVAKLFADEYVRYGALVAEVTSQAAVIDLTALGDAAAGLQNFSGQGRLFMPLVKPVLDRTRNDSYEIGGGSSIDLLGYLDGVAADNDTPKRFSEASIVMRDFIRTAMAFDRVFISPIDRGLLTPDSFQGLSIFFPNITAQMGDYKNSSGIAAAWTEFLGVLRAGTTYAAPQPDLALVMLDLKYADGLDDALSFTWNATSEIDEWSCDALALDEGGLAGGLNFSDAASQSGAVSGLNPGYYEVCAYGIGSDGKYRYYAVFDDVAIMRRFTYNVHLPEAVADGRINTTNLRTGVSRYSEVSGDTAVISFEVPTPFIEGDRVLLALESDNITIARGFVVLSGDSTDVHLTEASQPTTISSMILFLLVAALMVSAFVGLKGADWPVVRRMTGKKRK